MKTEVVQFAGTELQVLSEETRVLVVMKPICEALSLDWASQHKLIVNDPVLGSTISVTETVGADGKQREMLCLPLDYLNGWLFKINANRYKGGRRELIIKYQRECYKVLAEHFLGNRASSHTAANMPTEPLVSFDDFQAMIKDDAAHETAKLTGELRSFCARHGILAHDELLFLASQSFVYHSPTAPLSAMDVHPATASRCLARIRRLCRGQLG